MGVKVVDHTVEVLAQMNANRKKALTAIGIKAVNLILWQMRQGFGKPIRKTGDLQRDLSSQLSSDTTVDVGNSLNYAPYVHDGTWKMSGRPYIKAGITGEKHAKEFEKIAKEYLKQGFE